MPRIPAMLVTRETRFPARREASTSLISPVGRSTARAGALGLEGEEKMYESEAVWTLMSRKGSAMVLSTANAVGGGKKRGFHGGELEFVNCSITRALPVEMISFHLGVETCGYGIFSSRDSDHPPTRGLV
jgi:hypothetical protein